MQTAQTVAQQTLEETFLVEVTTHARRCARRYLTRDDADDVAQDVVLECLIKLREGGVIPASADIPNLVRNMVRRRAIDLRRANTSRALRESASATEPTRGEHTKTPDVFVEESELQEFFNRTLARLPRRCREVYLLVRRDGATYQSVANETGLTRRAVQWHVVTARQRFRRALAKEGLLSREPGRPTRVEVPLQLPTGAEPCTEVPERLQDRAA